MAMIRSMRQISWAGAILLGTLISGLAVPARADHAVVAAVNNYQSVGPNLHGCVADALSVKAVLEKYGFQVIMVADAQATRQGILDTLETASKVNTPQERFVFYFAGHGTDIGGGAILPSDTADSGEGPLSNVLSPELLNQKILAVPARSHTVLLDSCFSGGMMRALSTGTMRPRYYRRRSKDLVLKSIRANNADTNEMIMAGSQGKVCYYTATRANETAGEDEFGTDVHGLFTHFLCNRLSGGNARWSDIQPAVSSDVSKQSKDNQHPTLTPTFSDAPLFEGLGTIPGPPPPTKGSTLWDDYNADHPDASQVRVTLVPDRGVVEIGDSLRFTTTVGGSGYLVLIERGTSGKISLLSPASRRVDDAKADTGLTISIPGPDEYFEPDQVGTERIRAILFSSRDKAAALLAKFPDDLKIDPNQLERDLVLVKTTKSTFYSSDIQFQVVGKGEASGTAAP